MVKRGGRTLGCVRRRRVGGGGEDLLLHWGRGRRRAPQGHRSVSPECRLGSTGLRSSTPKAPAFRSRVKTKGEEQLFFRLVLSLPLSHRSDWTCAALGGTEWVCLTAAYAGFTLVCTAHMITHACAKTRTQLTHRCKTTHRHTQGLTHIHSYTNMHTLTHVQNTVHTHTCKATQRCTLNTHACTRA